MGHRHIQHLMTRVLDGPVSFEHLQKLQAHLQECALCMREWQVWLDVDAIYPQSFPTALLNDFVKPNLSFD